MQGSGYVVTAGRPRWERTDSPMSSTSVTYQMALSSTTSAAILDACVNPEHLEAVTQLENFMRGEHLSAVTARENRCQRGHEFTPENTIIVVKRCKACVKAKIQERRAASR